MFFHFSQSIIRKIRNIKLLEKKLNKNTFVILNNIQIISFINPELLENYIKFLEEKLTEPKEIELMIYIKNYWINKRGINSFNYYNFINEINKKYGLKYLFITNNIIESFHGKIAKYLTKGKTTSKTFISAMTKILKDCDLEKNNIKRHDYKTQTLINIANNYKETKDFKWFNFNEFYELEKKIIQDHKKGTETGELEKVISDINNVDIDENIEDEDYIKEDNLSNNSEYDNHDYEVENANNNENINTNENLNFIYNDTQFENFVKNYEGLNEEDDSNENKFNNDSIINEIEKSKKIKKIKYPSAKRNYNSRNIKEDKKIRAKYFKRKLKEN